MGGYPGHIQPQYYGQPVPMNQPMYQPNYGAPPQMLQPVAQPVPQQKEPSPKPPKQPTPEPEKPKPTWQCSLCTTKNGGESYSCITCNAPKLTKTVKKNADVESAAPNLVGVTVRR